MSTVVAQIATNARPGVVILETAVSFAFRYEKFMIASWVQEALDSANISQAKAARILSDALKRSIDRAAVNKMVKGTRKVTADELMELSRMTGVPAPMREETAKTAVLGYVGAGSIWAPFELGAVDEIERPAWANERTVAAEIRGDSLGSMFDRWLVYYDDVREEPSSRMMGKLCIVWLADKRVMVKVLERSQVAGLFNLRSNFAEPIYDVAVERCALVRTMAPR